MKKTHADKIHDHFSPFSPALLLGMSIDFCQRVLVIELGIIRTQMGKHNRSVMVTVYGVPCAVPPCDMLILLVSWEWQML
jgi:hypothetical protein